MRHAITLVIPLVLGLAAQASATPRLFIGADEETVLRNGSTVLRWNIDGASACQVSANGYALWGGTSGAQNTSLYGGLTQDTTYTLACTMSSGATLSGSVTVRVVSIRAVPENIVRQGQATISWLHPNASACLVYANGYALWGGTSGSGNTSAYGALTQDTVYELRCTTSRGTESSFATVRVPSPVNGPAPDFANVKGANIFSGPHWFGDTAGLVDTLSSMNLNFARLPVDLGGAVAAGTENELVTRLRASLDALNAANKKAIVLLAGYSTYELAPAPCSSDAASAAPFAPFVDVRDLARRVFVSLNDHPALYAYEVQNEAFSSQAAGHHCDRLSIQKSVLEMYRLLKSVDSNVPTTVSEAWYWWELQHWAALSSFWSYHIYPGELSTSPGYLTTPLNAAKLALAGDRLEADIVAIRQNLTPALPVVLGEFGYLPGRANGLNPTEVGQFYRAVYDRAYSLNIGTFFWNLSSSDPYSILGTPAAQAVTTAHAAAATFPGVSLFANPSTVAAGQSSTLSWEVPGATSCLVWSNGYALWGGVSGTGNTALYGNPTQDAEYQLVCTMRGGGQRTGTTRIYVR